MNNMHAVHNILDQNEIYFLKTSLPFDLQDIYDEYITVDFASAKKIFVNTVGQENLLWLAQRQVRSLKY